MPFIGDRLSANLRLRYHSIILICSLIVGCGSAESGETRQAGTPNVVSAAERIRAVTLDARQVPSDSVLLAIRELGATHVTLVSFGFQESVDDPQIRFSPDVRWYSESATGARETSDRAEELGMGIILKPQIWLRGGKWTADIDFRSEDGWRQWEAAYRSYLMQIGRLAEEIGADVLVVGTELGNPVRERPAFWSRLIEELRQVYGGRLTYGANWHDDYEQVSFWEALDYIGIQAYFPLSNADDPTLANLRTGWDVPLEAIELLSEKENMPVLFTEVGYRSVPYAAEEPWRWPSPEESTAPDFALQADLFRAFFDRVWVQSWFAGAIIWKFYPESRRHPTDLDFTPQGKPAEEVIRDGFGR